MGQKNWIYMHPKLSFATRILPLIKKLYKKKCERNLEKIFSFKNFPFQTTIKDSQKETERNKIQKEN